MSISDDPHDRRALLIVHQFPPAATAGVFRTIRFAKYLPAFGWTPIVLTATPADAGDAESAAKGAADAAVAVSAQVRVERVVEPWASKPAPRDGAPSGSPARTPRTGGKLRPLARIPWQLLTETPDRHVRWVGPAVLRGRRLIRETRPDVLYTSGPPHSVHLAGAILKRLTGLPWIADLRDPWARRPWKKTANPWGSRFLGSFERGCVRRADAVILNTEPAAADFRSAYPDAPPEKFHVIPNGCDPDLAVRAAELIRRSRREPDGEFRLLHPGSCYGRRDPRFVVDAVAALARRGIRIRFEQVGHCAPNFALTEYARERGVEDRVSVESAVPHEEILRRMASADALLLLQPEAPLMVPGKLYEMLPFRKPMVAVTDEGATADIVHRFDLGPVVRSGDVAGLVESLATLADQTSPPLAGAAGVDEALYVFDGEALTGRLAGVFNSTIRAEAAAVGDRLSTIAKPHSAADGSHRPELASFSS